MDGVDNKLVDIRSVNDDIKIDLRYATTNNFTGKKLYSKEKCLLKKEVAYALSLIQKELGEENLSLLIWDGYRPKEVQETLKSFFEDRSFVSDISNHSRGISVDLTLYDNKTKTKLNMGTDFDDFSKKANSSYANFPNEIIENRNKLKNLMEKYGFLGIDAEWWHFDYKDLTCEDILNYRL